MYKLQLKILKAYLALIIFALKLHSQSWHSFYSLSPNNPWIVSCYSPLGDRVVVPFQVGELLLTSATELLRKSISFTLASFSASLAACNNRFTILSLYICPVPLYLHLVPQALSLVLSPLCLLVNKLTNEMRVLLWPMRGDYLPRPWGEPSSPSHVSPPLTWPWPGPTRSRRYWRQKRNKMLKSAMLEECRHLNRGKKDKNVVEKILRG